MESAAVSAPFNPISGPFVIGALSAPGEARWPGLVAPDWLRIENAPGFTPLGPWIVPADSIPDPSDLQATPETQRRDHAGRVGQGHGLDVAQLVAYISQNANCFPAT